MSDIDLDLLTEKIRELERHQKLYKVLKTELSRLGYWQNKPRGNPSSGYVAMKERKSN